MLATWESKTLNETKNGIILRAGLEIITDVLKGDLNDDGTLTPADAAIALEMAVRGEYSDIADVSGDHRLTSLDALMILRMAADGA